MWHLHLREYQQDEGGEEITRSSGVCERRLWSTVVRERYAVGRQASDRGKTRVSQEQMDNETKRQEAVQTRVVLYRNAQSASMG